MLFLLKYGGVKMKKELRYGLILLAIHLLFSRFLNAPELVHVFLLGLSIFLMVIGILPEKVYTRIKQLKGEN